MLIVEDGTVELELENGNDDSFNLMLHEIAYAFSSRCNLLFISKLARAEIHESWNLKKEFMQLQSSKDFIIDKTKLNDELYHLQIINSIISITSPQIPFVTNVDFTNSVWKKHRRLSHLSLQRMLQLCTQNVEMKIIKKQIQTKLKQVCSICAIIKAIVRMLKDSARVRYEKKKQLVHANIWDSYSMINWDGTRWMCFVTDDATRIIKTFRFKTLTEFPELLRALHKKKERRYQISILRYKVNN